jgi:hypothetical protein
MQPYIGLMQLMPLNGQWQLHMQLICIITCHMWKPEFLLWTCSQRQDGSRRFMTVMLGDVQYMCWTHLGDGKKIPKLKLRSKQLVYMGNLPKHSITVPLVLNPEIGAITAQFHVIFDDWFATVAASETDLLDLQSEEWTQMFGNTTHIDLSEDNELEATVDDYIIQSDHHCNAVSQAIEGAQPTTPLLTTPPPVKVPIDKSTSIAAPASHDSPE